MSQIKETIRDTVAMGIVDSIKAKEIVTDTAMANLIASGVHRMLIKSKVQDMIAKQQFDQETLAALKLFGDYFSRGTLLYATDSLLMGKKETYWNTLKQQIFYSLGIYVADNYSPF